MRRFRDVLDLSGRDREGLVQAAKMAVAAVIAWMLARQVHEPQSFIAPYMAVFMMGGTIFRSLRDAALLVITMMLGVVVAFLAAVAIPWVPLTLAVAVFVGMVIGRWRRFGSDGIWVGAVALLMITYGTADNADYLAYRVAETVLGAVVGLSVNVLVFPPLRLREGERAVTAAAVEIADLLRTIADGLRAGWDRDDARQWHRNAIALERAVREADDVAGEGRESTWFNPWAVLRGRRPVQHDSVLDALYDVTEQVRHMGRTLLASEDPNDGAPRTGPVFQRSFAELLEEIARAVDTFRERPGERAVDGDEVAAALRRVRELRSALARQTPWPDHLPPEDWSAHAALVLAAERALLALKDVRFTEPLH